MADIELIIKIPEEAYNFIKRTGYHTQSLYEAIKNGTSIPNNATNGDIIKAIFPDMRVGKLHDCIFAKDYKNVWFGEDWWNAPYQKGDNK